MKIHDLAEAEIRAQIDELQAWIHEDPNDWVVGIWKRRLAAYEYILGLLEDEANWYAEHG